MSDFFQNLNRIAFARENRAPLWQWAFDEIELKESPYGRRFVVNETPWLKEPLEQVPRNDVREIVLQCCAQGGKSVSMSVAACWALAQQPGPTMVVAQTEDAAKKFSRQRLMPMINSVDRLRDTMPVDRHEKTVREILFANATLMVGPANESFLRAHSIRWLFCDEVSDWKPGLLDQARARTTRYWNRRHWIASTPLEMGSDLDRAFMAGDQREWHLGCPHCGKAILPDFHKVVRWETNETTKPGGEWDFEAMRKTVRMVCPHCEKDIENTDANFRAMNRGGSYIAQNPTAPSHSISFRFNALCLPPSMMSWADLAEQFLRAKIEAAKGYMQPLKEFLTLRLAQVWDDEQAMQVKPIELGDYDPANEWPEEKVRFMTVDCQNELEDFWLVVRAWAEDGSSRLVDFKRPKSFEEIEELRKKHNVKPHLTFLDCGYERYRVLSECAKRGWAAMRGEDVEDYLHTGKRKVRRPYAPASRGDARDGSKKGAVVFRWSNPTIKDLLHILRTGRGAEWGICDLGVLHEEFARQMDGERKKQVVDRYGRARRRWVAFRANHAFDCEAMQVVAACMANLFKSGERPVEEEAPATSAP